jgi:hypothetical protein
MQRGRPTLGADKKTRRNIHLDDETWQGLEHYAAELGQKAGKPVSTSEALRRIVERFLKRRGK